jgi:Domain of unknown function (DUF4159)
MKKIVLNILCLMAMQFTFAQSRTVKIAKLKYNGGGDWYANKTALPNLINFCNTNLKTNIFAEEDIIEPGDPKIFQYPYIYMTGHGNVLFSDQEAKNMRKYLLAGGFFHIDDNYGLNKFIRREMKKVFPEHEFVEIPFNHPIYHQKFDFPRGLPKVHEHDNKPPQGYGIIHEGKLVCFFSFECDLGNGWEDQVVYNDPEYVRLEALKMGANLIQFSFSSF